MQTVTAPAAARSGSETELSVAGGMKARIVRGDSLALAERDLARAIERISKAAEHAHWTDQFRLSGIKTKIEIALYALQAEREHGEEGVLSLICRTCRLGMECAEESEGCSDPDCPMQRGETSVVIA